MIFYCMVRNDQTNSVHSRTVYLIEIFLTQVFFSLFEVLLGLLNLRFNNFIVYILIGILCGVLTHFLLLNKFNEDRGRSIIQKHSKLIRRRKSFLILTGISLFVGAFIFLILNGVLMSYLLSLYE
jgi:polyferredoxin